MNRGGRVAYACAWDPARDEVARLSIWLTTLAELAGADRTNVVVHVPQGADVAGAASLRVLRDVTWRRVPRFGAGGPFDKIPQFDDPWLADFDHVVFCEPSLAFCAGFGPWIGIGEIAARPVDLPNPSIQTLQALYAAAGFAGRPETVECSFSAEPTFANNCNRGIYVFRTDAIAPFGDAWRRWAGWVLERRELVGDRIDHADQISFGLAAWSLGMSVVPLPLEANMPTHLAAETYPAGLRSPVVLNYHDNLAADATLNRVGIDVIDAGIGLVNDALRTARGRCPSEPV